MIYALMDYFHYRKRTGRFSRNIDKSIMGGAFEEKLPEGFVSILKTGDVLFIQTFDSWISWIIMYLTQTDISHVAMYMGNRTILHATLSGVVREEIDNLFGSGIRILPVAFPNGIFNKKPEDIRTNDLVRKPYDLKGVFCKALLILSGRAWPYFRWYFLLDIATFFIFLDSIIYLVGGFLIFIYFLLCYFAVVLYNYLLSKVRGKSVGFVGDPGYGIYQLFLAGAKPIFDPSSLCYRDGRIMSKNIKGRRL